MWPVDEFVVAGRTSGQEEYSGGSSAPYAGFGRSTGLVNNPMIRFGKEGSATRSAQWHVDSFHIVPPPREYRYQLREPGMYELCDSPPPYSFKRMEYDQFLGDDLGMHGGTPPMYFEVLDRWDLEWPICCRIRLSGKQEQWVYIDRYAAVSVIGKQAASPDAPVRSCALRRSIDLPWKGRGDAYIYDSYADVSFFIRGALRMRHRFFVVTSLGEAVVLGYEFAITHSVWVEDRPGKPLRCWIRGRPVACERARRAWQVPDSRGGYRPRLPPPFMRQRCHKYTVPAIRSAGTRVG